MRQYDMPLMRPKSEYTLQSHNIRRTKTGYDSHHTALYFDSGIQKAEFSLNKASNYKYLQNSSSTTNLGQNILKRML